MKWHLYKTLPSISLGLLCLGYPAPVPIPGDEMSSPVTMARAQVNPLSIRTSGCCVAPEPNTASVEPRGIPVGPWTIPPELIGSVYNGGVLTGRAPYQDLEQVRARKGQVVLYLARKKSQDEYGTISVEAVRRFLATWPDITPYIRDGTVWGIMVSDDITGKRIWGPDAPYYPQIDSIAQLVKERWPGVRTIVRAPPTNMNYPWKWVSWAWAQYNNAPRNGEVTAFRDRQMARADSLGLCLAFGLNVVNGGDGSSGIGSGHRHQMTAAEVLKYYAALLPHTPVAFYWEYRPELEADPAMRAAMQQVRTWADTLPRPSCRYDKAG